MNEGITQGRVKRFRITETTLERRLIVGYVKQVFWQSSFPEGFCVALDDSAMVNKGDVIYTFLDSEHPYDFIPLPSIDQLIVNLPTRETVLLRLGVKSPEEISPEAEEAFWDSYPFEFAEVADGVKLTWE
jgi:hypothetical protein